MQYEQLIRDAWRLTWERRFLWWFALFAGSASTFVSTGGLRVDQLAGPLQDAMSTIPTELRDRIPDVLRWINQNIAILSTGAALLGIVLLLALIFSCAFKAALARATLDLARHQSTSLGQAWSAGLPYLWRFVGLSLMFDLFVSLAILALIGTFMTIGLLSVGGNPIGPAIGTILALPVGIASVVLAVIASIIFPYAEREVLNHDMGAVDGLRSGWRLLRTRIRHSLVVWFINMVVGVAASVMIGITFIIVGFVLIIPGTIMWWQLGPGALTIGYVGLAAAVAATVMFAMAAISNAFQWMFWSLAYVRLVEGEQPAPAS